MHTCTQHTRTSSLDRKKGGRPFFKQYFHKTKTSGIKMLTLESLRSSKGNKPYSVPIRVKICGIGSINNYVTDNGDKKESVILGVSDGESIMKVTLYDTSKLKSCSLNSSVVMMNYIYKSEPSPVIVVTNKSKIMTTSDILVSSALVDQAELIANPPPAKTVPLKLAKSSPVKTLLSVRGRVISEEMMKTVQVKGADISVKAIVIKDDTDEMRVSMWRELSSCEDVKTGQFLEISNVVVNSFRDEVSVSTTSKTSVQKCDVPPKILEGQVIAYEPGDDGLSIMVQDGEDFMMYDVSMHLLTNALLCENEEVENQLQNKLPLKCTMEIRDALVDSLTVNIQ